MALSGHYPGPPGPGSPDSYSYSHSVASTFSQPKGVCFFYMKHRFCKRAFCPYDHPTDYPQRQTLAPQACPQACPPPLSQAVPQQISSFQGPMQQTRQAPHQPCLTCCHPQGPVEHSNSFGPQRSRSIPHMAQHPDCGSAYSQESHESPYYSHQHRRQNNVDFQGNHQQHREAQYRSSSHNPQRGRSQSSSYSNSSKYHESPNFRQGNYDLQGPVQHPSYLGPQQFSGMPQQRYGSHMRTNGSGPAGPRADGHNTRFSFSDRSSQISMDDARNLTYWQSPTSRPATDASMSPRVPHEPQDLIDLHHGPEIDNNRLHKTALDLLEEDPPEDAKSMPIIIAAVSQESHSKLGSGLYELMAPPAEVSPQNGDLAMMATSYRNDSPQRIGQTDGVGNLLQTKGAVEGLGGASQNLRLVQDREHENSHDLTASPKARENTTGISGSKLSASTPENQPSTATTTPNPTLSPIVEETISLETVQKIRELLAPHLRAKVLGGLCADMGLPEDAWNSFPKPDNLQQPEPTKSAANICHVKEHGVDQLGEAKPAVAVMEQVTLNSNPVENSTAVAATRTTSIDAHSKQSETHSHSDDASYPSSVFSSLPSSPRLTTVLPAPSVYRPDPLPFPSELSFAEFKIKSICVSNVSFDRLYAADATSTTGVDSWETRPAPEPEKAPSNEPQPPSPKQQAPAMDDEFHGDDLLGPRPKPKWNKFTGNSRPPSPDHSASDEPQPLVRIARQHIFDIAYCWNCWSQKHKAADCPEPHRSLVEREQLRIQKRVVSKSWTRGLEAMGRQAAIISIPGISDEAASKLQTAVPLRNPRKKAPRNFSPAVSVYEENPGSPTDRPDWWNNTPPIPDISDAEVAMWANMTDSSTARHEGTYFEHPWSDTSMESGAETTISSESTEAHMDGACYHSLFNSRSISESDDESTTSLGTDSLMRAQQSKGGSFMTVGSELSGTGGNGNGVVDVEEDGVRGRDGKKESSDEEPRIRTREPRPEELQEPRVIFVDSELLTCHRRNTSPDKFEQALNAASLKGLLPKGKYRYPRKYTTRVDRISRLPTEILHEIIEYIGLQRLHDDPQNEGTVYERSRAERIRALNLRPLRFVNRKFYLVVQTIIYTRINITAIPDFERLARQLHMRERLANMVLDVTVDIHQLRKTENWRDYGKPRVISKPKSREVSQKMTLGTAHLIRDISSIFENCKFLSRFAFHCTGAIQAFCRLEGEYPSVKKVSICDQLEIGKCVDTFWRSIQRFPNIEEVSLLRSEENRDLDFRPIQINPVGKAWALDKFDNLQYLKFTNAAEISDKLLLYILPNLPKLSRIYLYECKLVTASGIARVITQIQDRLTEFVYCDYVDCNGKTSPDEEKTKKSYHLCHALARCPNLRDLSLSAYRCCSDLFTMSNWPYLRNLKIDMMFYTGCNGEEEDTDLREALVLACVEGRLPSLTSSSIIFQTNTPGLIYRRNRKFTPEELEKAGGYT